MSTFLLNVPPEPKFWRRHCSTGLERNSCMKFCLMFLPPQPKSWRRPCRLHIMRFPITNDVNDFLYVNKSALGSTVHASSRLASPSRRSPAVHAGRVGDGGRGLHALQRSDRCARARPAAAARPVRWVQPPARRLAARSFRAFARVRQPVRAGLNRLTLCVWDRCLIYENWL